MAFRNYSGGNGFIVSPDGTGDFTTITAALTALTNTTNPNSPYDVIYLNGGTYSDNFTATHSIVGLNGAQLTGTITIGGGSGNSISNVLMFAAQIVIPTTSAQFLFQNCQITYEVNPLITSTGNNSFPVTFIGCTFQNAGQLALFDITNNCYIRLIDCDAYTSNFAVNEGISTISAGKLDLINTPCNFPITSSGTSSINIINSKLNGIKNAGLFQTALTVGGSGTNLVTGSTFYSGTASAISVGSTLNIYDSTIDSSNTDAITGSGTINYGGLTFSNTSHTINTSTQNPTPLTAPQGGTGVANAAASTLTLGGALTTSGAYNSIFTMTGATGVTFPTSGTLATTSQLPTLPLSLANGGTGAALTASNGGIFYSNSSSGGILSGTSTANQVLMSGASTTPAWSTATYPATTTANQLLYSSSNNAIAGLSTANNGLLITSASGVPSILADGTTGQVLTATTGSPPSWVNPATSGTVTSVSVVSANGFAGTVATATSTPAITLTTTATGVLSGNGTAISGSAVTQYAVLVGGASNAITSVADVATGQVLVSGGVSANPAFSATPTLTSVTLGSGTALSVYQQGTFTPGIAFGGSSTGVTYSGQTGEYTQIGNIVYFAIRLVLSSTNALTGNVTITGLPVAAGASVSCTIPIAEFGNITLTALYTGLYAQISSGTSLALNEVGSGQAQTAFSQGSGTASIANNGVLIFTGFYFTS